MKIVISLGADDVDISSIVASQAKATGLFITKIKPIADILRAPIIVKANKVEAIVYHNDDIKEVVKKAIDFGERIWQFP